MVNRAAWAAQFHCMEFLIRQTHDPAGAIHFIFFVVLEDEEEKKMSMHRKPRKKSLNFHFWRTKLLGLMEKPNLKSK